MLLKKYDRTNKFKAVFDTVSGTYMRSGVLADDGKDTGIDPFMTTFPELIDIGVMGHCIHGKSGLCIKSGVECYQNGLHTYRPNMSLDNFKKIIDECENKTFQVALGGRGDVDQHEDFEQLLSYCKSKNIVPNFTTSGLGMTKEKAQICKKYCGAVAVSWYASDYTLKAISMLLEEKVVTNIHFVLSKSSIMEAIDLLKDNAFPKGINAVVFLLHKPIGQGTHHNVLTNDDKLLLKEFISLLNNPHPFSIGFDSCSIPLLLNYDPDIDKRDIDTCEGGRFSMYISSDMVAMPCSFDNTELKWGYSLENSTIQEAWDSQQFKDFRKHLSCSCPTCKDKASCMGGCPISQEIVLCNREDRRFL